MRGLVCALAAAAMAMPAQAGTERIDLVPSGKWQVDYADDGCVLSRPFTANGVNYKLAMTFEPVTPDVWLTLRAPGSVSHRDDGDTRVEVDGSQLSESVHFNVFKDKPNGTIRECWLRHFSKNFAEAKRTLRLDAGRYGHIQIDFEGFQEAMKSIDTCVDDLHRSLGVEPSLLKTIATGPEGLAGHFFDLPDFQDEFKYQMLYWVAPSGRVDECHLLAPTGKSNFDKNACEQLKKNGRFKPARDAAGTAIRAPVYENADIRKTVIRG